MNANAIKTQAKEWYTLGRNFLPELGTPQFAEAAGKSQTFVYETIDEDETPISLTVDAKVETAAADLHKREIKLSAKYFQPELYLARYGEEAHEDTSALAISLINGSVIHEALHFKYTAKPRPTSLDEAILDTEAGREAVAKYGMEAAAITFNVIEDIYIEHNCPPELRSWLQAASDIMFATEDLEEDWDLTQMNHFLALICAWKNKENRGHEAFTNLTKTQLSLLNKAATRFNVYSNGYLRWRVNLAMDLLNTFELPDPDEGEGEGEGEGGDGEGEDTGKTDGEKADEGKSGSGESGGEGGDESESESEGEGDNDGEGEEEPATGEPTGDPTKGARFADALDETESPDEDEIERVKTEVEDAAKEISDEMSGYEEYGTDYRKITWKKLVERDIMDHRTYGYKGIDPETKIDFTFLRNLQAIRTINRTPGAARKSGSVMVKSRLTRIATDGKIFAKRDATRNTLKRIEVIINIDFSGSTTGSVINNELGAAMAMSKTLRAAGIAHSVYGHTSLRGGRTPFLFHIYSFEMEVTNYDWDARFDKAKEVNLSQNFDGVVIKRLGEKFTGRDASKFLINLSDGEPAAPGYSGMAADSHTREEIQNLRSRGIAVFAISVVRHVVNANDRIYGKDFNVDGSHDTNAQFQRLIERIAQG